MKAFKKISIVLVCALALFTAACEFEVKDDRPRVTIDNQTGQEPQYAGYQLQSGAWMVRWSSKGGAAPVFRLDRGTYTIGLFRETTEDEVQAGGNGLFAKKVVTLTGDATIRFEAADLVL
jgi:hypothetical protein